MNPKEIFKPGAAAEHVSAREGYDRWARIYDEEANPLIALEGPRLGQLLGPVGGLDVLDLGCGTGRHSLRLAAGGARVVAVDFSDGMAAKAAGKAGWERVRFVSHDLTTPLPLPDAAFDRVVAALVLEHIPDLTAFFGECRRVCRPGGCIVVSNMHPAMMLRGILAHFRDADTGRDVCPASQTHQISDYVSAALRAGLRIDHISEHAIDESLAAQSPRAARYLHWPMLLMMRLLP